MTESGHELSSHDAFRGIVHELLDQVTMECFILQAKNRAMNYLYYIERYNDYTSESLSII